MSTTTSAVSGLPAGYRTTFAKVMRILAMVTGTLTVIQFALAGYGSFRAIGRHRGGFDAHETLGTIIGIFTLLVLIAAIVARPGRRPLIAAILLFLLAAPIQPLLADLGKHHGAWWGAVHAFVGIAILGLCGVTSRKIKLTE